MIRKARIYNNVPVKGEYRCLVDRLWPRGISKTDASLDAWEKDLGPSTELRKWFNHDPDKFNEFKKRYLSELQNPQSQEIISRLYNISKQQNLVLLFGAKEEVYNQASVLLELLEVMHD